MRGKLKNTVKKRILQILSMKDRIAVFAIMNVVDRHLQKTLYPDNRCKHQKARYS